MYLTHHLGGHKKGHPVGGKGMKAKNQEHSGNACKNLGLHPALEKHISSPLVTKTKGKKMVSYFPSNGQDKTTHSLKAVNSRVFIPGFDIKYEIGRGAMGQVFRATQNDTGQEVAIKVLGKELSERVDLVARFQREIFALKSLSHKNIVSIEASGNVNGKTHYFAMEYVDGITLRTRLGQKAMGLKETLFILQEILQGLSFAHKHGIIHRDLKPENVLLVYDKSDISQLPSRVVLVDFGLVGIGGVAIDPHPNLTKSKVTMGTVNYMAPEQHTDAKRVDFRSDIYSCGVLFYEMLTGDLPIGRYLMPDERGMQVPKKVEEVLLKSLVTKPEERYSSSEKMLMAIKDIWPTQTKTQASVIWPLALFNAVRNKMSPWMWLFLGLVLSSAMFFGVGFKVFLAQKTQEIKKEQVEPSKKPKSVDR